MLPPSFSPGTRVYRVWKTLQLVAFTVGRSFLTFGAMELKDSLKVSATWASVGSGEDLKQESSIGKVRLTEFFPQRSFISL